jgi:hypothetical protein
MIAEDMTDYASDGVDLTLIRWMLSKTPAERLDVLQGFLNALEEINELRASKRLSADSSGTAAKRS